MASHTKAGIFELCVDWVFAKLPAVIPCGVRVFQRSDEISLSLCGLLSISLNGADAVIEH